MKKLFFLLLVLLSLNAIGQYRIGPCFYFGKSDLPNSQVSIRAEANYTQYNNSYAFGVSSEYQMNNWFSVRLDVLYDHIASEHFYFVNRNDPNSYGTYMSNQLNYLSLPLTLQFHYKRFRLNCGYQTSLLVSNSSAYYTINYPGPFWETKNSGMYIKRNISFTSSLSYAFYKNFQVEFKFTNGLTNIMNGQAGYQYYAHTIQFLLGLVFKFEFKHEKDVNTEEVKQ